ncbi:MAG: M36 family metallopeptidase, partial [Actinomycetota bacterium]|nr:M36 family metallopeptidase [Actinomycetota bacterium]
AGPAGPAATPPTAGGSAAKGGGLVDVRRPADPAAQARAQLRSAELRARPPVRRLVHSLGPQAIVDIDPLTGTPRQVARLNGLLTARTTVSASTVALGYVRGHANAFGLDAADIDRLHLARDYVDIQGTHHLSFTQSAGGVTVFGNGLKANVTAHGQLVNVTGSPVHGLTAPPVGRSPLSATAAIRKSKQSAGETDLSSGPRDTATAVLFQAPSGLRRAWQTITMSAARPALSVIDVADGAVLYRDRLGSDLTSAATPTPYSADVFENYPGAAGAGGTAHTVLLTANNWLAAGAQSLAGNNVHTYTDIDGNSALSSTEEVKPTGTSGYRFTLHRTSPTGQGDCVASMCTWIPNTPFSWRASSNASRSATQNFYFINKWHDYLLSGPIGFTEAAGNFQQVNSSGLGKGADAIRDEPLSGASTNAGLPSADFIDNADFDTPPDGLAPTMRMFLFHEPFTSAAVDPFLPVAGSDTADIVYHEYTHGLSHRLVVDAGNVPALDSLQGSSMGEAWSDWYGLDYLVNNSATTGLTDGPGPDVIEGRYVLGPTSTTGIRSEPIDCPVGSAAAPCTGIFGTGGGGYTYGDVKAILNHTQGDVHAAGEVWAQTLWDLRGALIGSLGQGPGTQLAESLVTRGMELSPTYPSMLDMRNAIIAADQADYAGAHVDALWTVFAARGLGFFASSKGGDDSAPVQSFAVPPAPGSPTGTLTGTVTNLSGGAPLPGVTIGIAGHDSGFPGDYVTTTASDGTYSLADLVPGTYPAVYATGGVDKVFKSVPVAVGSNTQNWVVARDWASSSGGGRVADFTGIDLTSQACGPPGLIDQSLTVGWASELKPTAPYVVVRLPVPVDVSNFAIDPTSACGDAHSASLANFRIDTSVNGTTWTAAAQGSFGSANLGHLNVVTPGTDPTGVRWVRLTLLSAQASTTFVDATELEIYGAQSAPPPPHNHQGGHPPIPR